MVFGKRRRKHGKADERAVGLPTRICRRPRPLVDGTTGHATTEMHWLRLAKPGEELGKELGDKQPTDDSWLDGR